MGSISVSRFHRFSGKESELIQAVAIATLLHCSAECLSGADIALQFCQRGGRMREAEALISQSISTCLEWRSSHRGGSHRGLFPSANAYGKLTLQLSS